MKKSGLQLLPALLFCCIGTAAVRADPVADSAEPPPVTNAGIAAGRVFLDPQTGEPGPPPDTRPSGAGIPASRLSAEMRQKLDRSGEGLHARTLPDGTLLMDLQGRFQNFSAVTLDGHGEAHLSCGHSAGEIEQALDQGAGSPAGKAGSAP